MADQETIRKEIVALLETQLLAVLSTHRKGQPYANLVAFAVGEKIGEIYFATARSTRKFKNILQDNRIAMLFDNRSNNEADFHSAAAVTGVGKTFELKGAEKKKAEEQYLKRHPFLKDFLQAPTTALLKITITRYIMVTRFQEVFELHLGE